MTLTEVIAWFQAAQEIFIVITGKPSDKDIVRIGEILTSILLSIPYDEVDEDDNLWGLIASLADFKSRYQNVVFFAPTWPPIYPEVLPSATAPVRTEAEFRNAAKLVDFNVHTVALRLPQFYPHGSQGHMDL